MSDSSDERAMIVPAPASDFMRTLTVAQRRCLYWRFMTGGENRREAAEIAGVSERTVYEWLGRADFRAAWDDPKAWAQREVQQQRSGLELKSLHTAHALLDSPTVADGVKADVLAKALTDVRQTKQLHLDAATTATWAAMLNQWAARSDEILGAQKDGAQTGDNATIAGVEQAAETDEGVSDGDGR